jgi:anti-sigma regulatory factor (Ser/Thr protein kinase)
MNNRDFSADLASLHAMLDFIKEFLKTTAMDPEIKHKIVLASEEALVNIIKHGYSPDEKEGRVEISCETLVEKPGVKIVLKDQGIPFNPVEHIEIPESALTSNPNDLSLGGLGISIFISLMDRVEYQQIAGGNQLTLIKYI